MVPNRGAAAPWGAIYSAQGCRGLTRFFTISLKIHFQAVIKPQSKLLWVGHYGCRKLLFFSVGCRKLKKVGKHWCIPTLLQCSWHEGYIADIKAVARQALTNTVYDKLLNAKATQWKEAQTVAASLRDFPLTWRNTQIQMYWLWKVIRIMQ